jgi:hypothetical protein
MTALVHLILSGRKRTACGVQGLDGPNDQIVTCGACKRTIAYRQFAKGPLPRFPEEDQPVRFT